MTQKEMVIHYLDEFGDITPLDAMKELGIMRLAAVIFELKRDGHQIVTEMQTTKNRFGKTVQYAKYTIYGDK